MIDFFTQHQFWATAVAYWIFSAAVSSMPDPPAGGAAGYSWLFRFCHTVAGNLTTAFGNRIPGMKAAALLLVLPLAMSAQACSRYVVHPGSLNKTDSAAYDTLLVAESMINQARADYQSQQLPDQTRDAFNNLVRAYNVARQSWITYRGAIATNIPIDAYNTQLTQSLVALTAAIKALEEEK
jgi:hypothetical protein